MFHAVPIYKYESNNTGSYTKPSKTLYQTWLEKGACVFSRDMIIRKLENGSTTEMNKFVNDYNYRLIKPNTDIKAPSIIAPVDTKIDFSILTPECILTILANMRIPDEDEGTFSNDKLHKFIETAYHKLSISHPSHTTYNTVAHYIFNQLITLADILKKEIVKKTGALDDMSREEQHNFLFHVLSKGYEFYQTVLTDSEFCTYLLDQYQPICTGLMEEYGLSLS